MADDDSGTDVMTTALVKLMRVAVVMVMIMMTIVMMFMIMIVISQINDLKC